MISIFSDAVRLTCRLPRQDPSHGPQLLDFIAGGLANGISGQLFLPSLQEVLAPALVQVRGNALPAAEF